MNCCRTAPTAASDASVMMLVGAPDLGCTSNVASARAILTAENADVAASVHARSLREDLDGKRFSG